MKKNLNNEILNVEGCAAMPSDELHSRLSFYKDLEEKISKNRTRASNYGKKKVLSNMDILTEYGSVDKINKKAKESSIKDSTLGIEDYFERSRRQKEKEKNQNFSRKTR